MEVVHKINLDKIKIFESWKKEFFKIKELDYFNVYLVGTFNDYLNGKFSKFNFNTKYTVDEIHHMSGEELITLEKSQNLNYTDIDIVITDNDDIDKIKKVLNSSKEINQKYQILNSKKRCIFFDLKYQSCGVFQEYNTEGNDFDCQIIQLNFKNKIEEKKEKLPFKKHKEISEMGYKFSKPTLIKKQLVIN